MERYTDKFSSASAADDGYLNLIILSQVLHDDELPSNNDLDVIQRDIEKEVEFFTKTSIGPSMRPLTEDDIIIDKVSSDIIKVTWPYFVLIISESIC